MSDLRPLHDWMVVELEPAKETHPGSSIVRISDNPVRIGKVISIGPGKNYPDIFVPTEIEVGDRVVFFIASTETKSGKAVHHHLPNNQRLIRETDVLFVTVDEVEVSV